MHSLPLLLTESRYFPVSRYLSEEEVLDTENPFAAAEWGCVADSQRCSIYINESQAAECEETQETGGKGTLTTIRCG